VDSFFGELYKNPSKHVGLVQSGHHHIAEKLIIFVVKQQLLTHTITDKEETF